MSCSPRYRASDWLKRTGSQLPVSSTDGKANSYRVHQCLLNGKSNGNFPQSKYACLGNNRSN